METTGDRIKTARESRGLTQEQLGEKIGVTGVTIMRYEKEQREPSYKQLQKIADALHVNWLYFLGNPTNEPELEVARNEYKDQEIYRLAYKLVIKAMEILYGERIVTELEGTWTNYPFITYGSTIEKKVTFPEVTESAIAAAIVNLIRSLASSYELDVNEERSKIQAWLNDKEFWLSDESIANDSSENPTHSVLQKQGDEKNALNQEEDN